MKTWCYGFERTGQDIKIEEILDKHQLKLAVLSSFQWDMEWLFRKLKVEQTKFIFIMQAKEQSFKDEMLQQTAHMRKFLRLCFPSMEGQINCMHSKLMLLFHPEKLRVAVPTANLLAFDWGESGALYVDHAALGRPASRIHAEPGRGPGVCVLQRGRTGGFGCAGI